MKPTDIKKGLTYSGGTNNEGVRRVYNIKGDYIYYEMISGSATNQANTLGISPDGFMKFKVTRHTFSEWAKEEVELRIVDFTPMKPRNIEADRKWFDDNPSRMYRLRPQINNELDVLNDPEMDEHYYVLTQRNHIEFFTSLDTKDMTAEAIGSISNNDDFLSGYYLAVLGKNCDSLEQSAIDGWNFGMYGDLKT